MKVLINLFITSIALLGFFKSNLISVVATNQIPPKLFILMFISAVTFILDLIWSLIIKCDFVLSDEVSSTLKIAMFGVLGYSFLNDAIGLGSISVEGRSWNHCIVAVLAVIVPILLNYSFVAILKRRLDNCDE